KRRTGALARPRHSEKPYFSMDFGHAFGHPRRKARRPDRTRSAGARPARARPAPRFRLRPRVPADPPPPRDPAAPPRDPPGPGRGRAGPAPPARRRRRAPADPPPPRARAARPRDPPGPGRAPQGTPRVAGGPRSPWSGRLAVPLRAPPALAAPAGIG